MKSAKQIEELEYLIFPSSLFKNSTVWVILNDNIFSYNVYKIGISENGSTFFAKSNLSPFSEMELNGKDYNKTWFTDRNEAIIACKLKENKQ